MKTFEEALEYAKRFHGESLNVYEDPNPTWEDQRFSVVYTGHEAHYEGKLGYILWATVRYEQKVEIL